MQSTFMENIPENFADEWLFVVCPPGKRRLLVAAKDFTETYNSAGAPELKFRSCLPNGSHKLCDVHKIDDLTILDTVYSPEKKRFFIVDLLHWRHYPYYDTEAEFRFFVLPSKYSELDRPTEIDDDNEHPLELLEKYPCTLEKIEEVLKSTTFKVEGLLFIKKDSLYVTKDSEEVLWLKLDKMEKVLGVKVPEGVTFANTNSRDEKRRTEQEDRKKLKLERMAARQKEAADKARRLAEAELKSKEENASEENGEGGNDNTEACDGERGSSAQQEENEGGE
ncbi:snurportin-1 [Aplysia californica]|uniref:Snurportin-1 n=1 Tax=Aplysia californica TaxID=6500 RepID=A0ABM1A7E1_APLCA|nr:snurportin-1 [Aplysia californica]